MCLRNPREKEEEVIQFGKLWDVHVIILNRASMLYIGDVKKQREGEKLKSSRLERDGGSKIAKERQKNIHRQKIEKYNVL